MSHHLDQMLAEATTKNLSLAQGLEALIDREIESREQRSIQRRFKLSRLQTKPSIDSFHFHHHKSRLQLKTRILRLLDLDFLRQVPVCASSAILASAKPTWPKSSAGVPARIFRRNSALARFGACIWA